MTPFATRKDFDAWARRRLTEMDAGLAAMDAETATRESVMVASRTVMGDARAWRDRFAACAALAENGLAEKGGDNHFKDMAPALREAWLHFEAEMENWAAAAEQKSAAFDARARALLSVWHAAAAGYKARALTVADAQRCLFDTAVERFECEAALYIRKFEDLQDAGKLSWIAMGKALKESRAAFEQANAFAQTALSA